MAELTNPTIPTPPSAPVAPTAPVARSSAPIATAAVATPLADTAAKIAIISPPVILPDPIVGTDDNDNIVGTAGNDIIQGLSGEDSIQGLGGDDNIDGGFGNDTIDAGEGDDYINETIGQNTIAGGLGNDYLNLAGTGNDFTLTYTDANNGTTSTGDTISGIETLSVTGTQGNDTINATAAKNLYIQTEGGDDSITGTDGTDTISGGEGKDTISSGKGDDYLVEIIGQNTIDGGEGIDSLSLNSADVVPSSNGSGVTLTYTDASNGSTSTGDTIKNIETLFFTGSKGNDTVNASAASSVYLYGLDGDDILTGTGGNDSLDGGEGKDTLTGGAGDDYLSDSFGGNTIDGGTGNDNLYINALNIAIDENNTGATLTYTDASNGSTSSGDTIKNVETISFTGSKGNDTVNASAASSVYLNGLEGDDTLNGTDGNDYLDGGEGKDTLNGGAGDDYLSDSVGNNTIVGGEGKDTLSLYTAFDSKQGVTVDYSNPNGVVTTNGGDIISGIEALSFSGGAGDDTLNAAAATEVYAYGNGGNDSLGGGSGNDFLYGGTDGDKLSGEGGNDTLFGENGNDILLGGDGDDTLSGSSGEALIFAPDGTSTPAAPEVDSLTGGAGKDSFVIADNFFNRNAYATGGNTDYVSITDFSTTDGDSITLTGKASDYSLATPADLPIVGTGIYRGTELIAIVSNPPSGGLDLNATYFKYVDATEPIFYYAKEGTPTADPSVTTSPTPIPSNPPTPAIENPPLPEPLSPNLPDPDPHPIVGTRRDDVLNGTNLGDKIEGLRGDDTLYGNNGNDILMGGKGEDTLSGGNGQDILTGGFHDDVLTGGSGADTFVFDGPSLRYLGVDEITDFNGSEGDRISLSKSVFTKLGSSAGNGFSVGTDFAIVDDSDDVDNSSARIVYDRSTGSLSYNANGSKSGLGRLGGEFASLDNMPTLTADSFVITD